MNSFAVLNGEKRDWSKGYFWARIDYIPEQPGYLRCQIRFINDNGIPLSIKVKADYQLMRALRVEGYYIRVRAIPRDNKFIMVKGSLTTHAEMVNMVEEKLEMMKTENSGEELVKFTLNHTYLDSHQSRYEMAAVFIRAFGMNRCSEGYFNRLEKHSNAITVLCTLSQFAKFLIRRNELGIKNGFKDLNAEIVKAHVDPAEAIAEQTDLDSGDVSMVLDILETGFGMKVKGAFNHKVDLDVTGRN